MKFGCSQWVHQFSLSKGVKQVFDRLFAFYGPRGWWPGDTPLEIMVGAILTQGVNWTNVERAINNLKQEELLNLEGLREVEEERLSGLIRPSGYYNMKCKKLKALAKFLTEEYGGDTVRLFAEPLSILRPGLLQVYGIGPETADSILLYAGEYPVFVIDAYTRRVFSRMGYLSEDYNYSELQTLITDNLEQDVELFNEYHALLVALGKERCKKHKPRCEGCPLELA